MFIYKNLEKYLMSIIFGGYIYTAKVEFNDGKIIHGNCQEIHDRLMGSSSFPRLLILQILFSGGSNVNKISISEEWKSPRWIARPETSQEIFHIDQQNLLPQDAALIIEGYLPSNDLTLVSRIVSVVDGVDLF
jgi:hypothetical protein